MNFATSVGSRCRLRVVLWVQALPAVTKRLPCAQETSTRQLSCLPNFTVTSSPQKLSEKISCRIAKRVGLRLGCGVWGKEELEWKQEPEKASRE